MAFFITIFFPKPERGIRLPELFVNAVEHGNLCISYSDKSKLNDTGEWEDKIKTRLVLPENNQKKVRVSYFINHETNYIELTIKDEGEGF